jgi:hypothetical protein
VNSYRRVGVTACRRMQCMPYSGAATPVFVYVNRYSPMSYEPDNIFLGRAMLEPLRRNADTLPLRIFVDTAFNLSLSRYAGSITECLLRRVLSSPAAAAPGFTR